MHQNKYCHFVLNLFNVCTPKWRQGIYYMDVNNIPSEKSGCNFNFRLTILAMRHWMN